MAAWCLLKSETDKFLTALRDGTVDPEKLIDMSSAERRAFFAKLIGEDNAKEVNALLEAKLLLKDQKRGMVTWAKQIAGLSDTAKADLVSRIERMDKVLDPTDEHSFLADLAAKKLGVDGEISFDEAKAVSELSKKVTDSRAAINETDPVGSPSRLEYGANYVALQNLVHDLKNSASATTLEDIKQHPLQSAGRAAVSLPGLAKSIMASFDDSYAGRQGFRAIFTHPTLWAQNFVHSLEYIAKSLGKPGTDHSIIDGVRAEIFSRPNAIDGTYKAMKLDVGITSEEAYPTSLPARIPGIGRLYSASETAYNGMAMRLRADIADQVIATAKNSGIDLSEPRQLESLGRLVNSLTGRGSLGQFEKVGKAVNVWFFSPKSLKASFDFLTLHAGDDMTVYARKLAATNLLKVTAGIATIMGVANALWPGSVEFDPRSADFGKIRIGDSRFDITGGMASLATLAARIVTLSSKSSTTGRVNKLNSGKFGSQTALDVAVSFATNKASPAGSILIDYLKGQTFQGTKPTVLGELANAFVPFPVSNVQQMMSDPKAANPILGEIADAFGINVNTYAPTKKQAP